MFVLQSHIFRNGAQCREYFQPEVTEGPFVGVVFAPLMGGPNGAKEYATEEEALADIDQWVEIARNDAHANAREFDEVYFRGTITTNAL